jgi:hypothetical protein
MADQLPDYRGYFLDAYQFGIDWQVRVSAGLGFEVIPYPFNVGRGRTRQAAYEAAKALVDDFLAELG